MQRSEDVEQVAESRREIQPAVRVQEEEQVDINAQVCALMVSHAHVWCVSVCCCVLLQYVAVCCCVLLQCVAVCCGVLQCVAVCCGVLQCVGDSFAARRHALVSWSTSILRPMCFCLARCVWNTHTYDYICIYIHVYLYIFVYTYICMYPAMVES